MPKRLLLFLLLLTLLLCTLALLTAPKSQRQSLVPYTRDCPTVPYRSYLACETNCAGPRFPRDAHPFFEQPYEDFKDESAPKTRTVTFLGEEYTGNYEFSFRQRETSYALDQYVGETSFCVENGSGRLVYISFRTTGQPAPDVERPREYALALAEQTAAHFIDLDACKMEVTEQQRYYNFGDARYPFTLYTIRFAKPYGDLLTAEHVILRITSAGHLESVDFGEAGGFEALTDPDFNEEAIDASIYAALVAKGLRELPDHLWMDYGVEERTLIRTPLGELAVLSTVRLRFADLVQLRIVETIVTCYTPYPGTAS